MIALGEQQRCVGCGSSLPAQDGPVHAYMISSPACFAAFGQVLAREYSSAELMPAHRLTVDAWAVQHPGDGARRAVQSVGLHLARLLIQLDDGVAGEDAHARMLEFARRKAELPPLSPPSSYRMTVADVVDAQDASAHRAAVERWARATLADWAPHHGFIRRWIDEPGAHTLGDPLFRR